MSGLSKKGGKSRPKPAMNVTPLVDIVLVLLIIFMVVIPSMEKNAQVELPSIFHADEEAKSKTDPFTVSLTKDGEFFFEEEPFLEEALEVQLKDAQEQEPNRRLVLRADRDTDYEHVRRLYKMCQQIGFPGMSIRVNEPAGAGDGGEGDEEGGAGELARAN